MKITYIHQHFRLPSEGGGGRPFEFARRMVSDGHEVTMICGGTEKIDADIDGIAVKRLPIPYTNAMAPSDRIMSFLKFMISASRVTARTDADVIFASSTPLTVAVPAIVGKVVQRVPMVFEVRDLWPSVPIELGYLNNPLLVFLSRMLERLAYWSSDSVVALSPGMAAGVKEVSPRSSVTVVPNASDFALFQKDSAEIAEFRKSMGWQEDDTVIVYAGGFGPTYNLEWIVNLAAAVRSKNIFFALLGEGKDSQYLRSIAVDSGLDPELLFPGKKSRSEVSQFVASADLVISSLSEDKCLEVNSLNKVFDGLAASKPIIFNHEGWLKDLVLENEAGWKLDRDVRIAARELGNIANNRSALVAASQKSAEVGRAQFDREDLYRNLMTVIELAYKTRKG